MVDGALLPDLTLANTLSPRISACSITHVIEAPTRGNRTLLLVAVNGNENGEPGSSPAWRTIGNVGQKGPQSWSRLATSPSTANETARTHRRALHILRCAAVCTGDSCVDGAVRCCWGFGLVRRLRFFFTDSASASLSASFCGSAPRYSSTENIRVVPVVIAELKLGHVERQIFL